MNRLTAFSLSLALILLGGGGLAFIRSHQKLGNPGVKLVRVPLYDEQGTNIATESVGLPEMVLDFSSMPSPITRVECNMLPKDTTYGRRVYTNTSGFQWLTSVVLMGKDRTSIHQPQFCLVSQGWNIERSELVSIHIDRPHPYELPVMKLTASRVEAGQRLSALYVYWFVAEDNLTAEHSQRMLSMLKVLLEKGVLERWAYVSYFTVCPPGGEDDAFKRLSGAIQSSVPEFQLTTGSVGGSPAKSSPQSAILPRLGIGVESANTKISESL